MATITTTATFAPQIELWETPMRPDNTPVLRGTPIGRVRWFSSVVVPALVGADVNELAVTLNTVSNYALRLVNINWDCSITSATAAGELDEVEDQALLTIPQRDRTLNMNLAKNPSAVAYNITNVFSTQVFSPKLTGAPVEGWQEPFMPTTPMIFRVLNISAGATSATSYSSNVSALIYTVEQYNQGDIWRTQSVT